MDGDFLFGRDRDALADGAGAGLGDRDALGDRDGHFGGLGNAFHHGLGDVLVFGDAGRGRSGATTTRALRAEVADQLAEVAVTAAGGRGRRGAGVSRAGGDGLHDRHARGDGLRDANVGRLHPLFHRGDGLVFGVGVRNLFGDGRVGRDRTLFLGRHHLIDGVGVGFVAPHLLVDGDRHLFGLADEFVHGVVVGDFLRDRLLDGDLDLLLFADGFVRRDFLVDVGHGRGRGRGGARRVARGGGRGFASRGGLATLEQAAEVGLGRGGGQEGRDNHQSKDTFHKLSLAATSNSGCFEPVAAESAVWRSPVLD